MEVGVECVRVPDRIINTDGIESEVLLFCGFMLAVAGILLIKHSISLLNPMWVIFPPPWGVTINTESSANTPLLAAGFFIFNLL